MLIDLNILLLTALISIGAFVYSEILTDDGMILYKWKQFLFMRFKDEDNWLYKIIVHCAYCVAGQWTLWTYLILALFDKIEYNTLEHILMVLFSVFIVALIKTAGIYGND